MKETKKEGINKKETSSNELRTDKRERNMERNEDRK